MLRRRLGPDTASCLPDRVWPAENQTEVWLPESRDQGCSVIGKFTQGSKADGKKANKEAGDRPRRAQLPCPGHPSLRHFGRSTNEVRAGSHPHLLRWFPAPVHPPEGEYAVLCPHQPPLDATEVRTR